MHVKSNSRELADSWDVELLSSSAGPMPLSFNSCGVLKALPGIITSFDAVAELGVP
jgi:hypothetical protein